MRTQAHRHEERVQPCDVPDGDLVRHMAGALGGARREWVEAHIRVCPSCQDRHAKFAEADRLLREHAERLPVAPDPARHAAMRAAIEHAVARRAGSPGWRAWENLARWRPRHPYPFLCLAVLKVALLAVLLADVPKVNGIVVGALALVTTGLVVTSGWASRRSE